MTSLASNIQSQDYRYAVTVPQGTWRWTTRVDVSQATPVFEVRDIYSPFGLLRDSIAIPGDVVAAMANSITELKSAFAPLIVVSPTSLTFTVDEGRGFDDPQNVSVTNGGVYGSLLAAALTTSAGYVQVIPANISSLSSSAAGTTAVSVDSTNLFSANSPYAATITVQDVNAPNSPLTLPVTIVVRPKATISLSPTTLSFTANVPITPPFAPIPSQTFQIQNTGPSGSVLSYQIQKLTGLSDWLVGFGPSTGDLTSSASQNVTVVVQPPDGMVAGTYTETLRVSGYSSNAYQDIVVNLTIS